jgi:hypothetical protein
MPRVNSALKGWKAPTRDRKKRQTRFDHDPYVLTMEKIRASVKQLANAPIKPIAYSVIPPELLEAAEQLGANLVTTMDDLVEGNLTTGTWADDDTSFDP